MASATATLSTTPRRIDEPAITQMRNPFKAPFGSRVASGLVADSDWPASLPLKVMSHPLETRSRDRPFRWKFTVSHFFVVGGENSCSDAAFRREVLKCFTVTR